MTLSIRGLVVVAVAVGAASLAAVGGPGAAPACAAQTAKLVVVGQDGVARHQCVALPEGRANGVELLRLARYDVVTRDYGGSLGEAVCSLDGEGTPASDCPSAAGHWHLWIAGTTWSEAILGPSSTVVSPGTMIGWTWQTTGDAKPPAIEATDRACLAARKIPLPESKSRTRAYVAPVIVGLAAVGVLIAARRRRKPEIT